MRFAIAAAVATVCAFALGANAAQFNSALFSEEIPSENLLQDMFTSFMQQYNKAYTHTEFFQRYNQFKSNVEIIRVHNAYSGATFTLGINEFADLSLTEFKAKYFGYNQSQRARSSNAEEIVNTTANPASVDWVSKGAVTGVKNQGQCGSCWAFSATGSLEGAWVLQGGHALTSFSEQQIVDCDTAGTDQGCDGGLMDGAFEWIEKNGGICTEASYPYKGVDGTCQHTCKNAGSITGFKDVAENNEAALETAVATVGPVSIAIEADQSVFQLYTGGVITGTKCGTNLDHGVLVVGYGTDATAGAYWNVKNSWGTSWGEKGYVRLGKNTSKSGAGVCGLASLPSYPTV